MSEQPGSGDAVFGSAADRARSDTESEAGDQDAAARGPILRPAGEDDLDLLEVIWAEGDWHNIDNPLAEGCPADGSLADSPFTDGSLADGPLTDARGATGSDAGAGPSTHGTSDLGRFGWFAESDYATWLAAATRRRRRGKQSSASVSGPPASAARPGGRHAAKRRFRLSRRGGTVALAVGTALACTLLGGVIGGFIAVHDSGSRTDPSYSLGPVPQVPVNRAAGSVSGIAARDMPGVVMIKVNDGQGTGSGFIIRGGYIITNNHVVTLDGLVSKTTLEIFFSNGKSALAKVVGRDPFSDIAVLKPLGVSNLPTLTLGNSGSVAVGDPVIAIGSPLGLVDTVTSGIVSAVDRPVQPGTASNNTPRVFFDAIQTDAPINPGNSGGPLVNGRGEVIGVDAAIDTLGQNPLTGSQGGSIGLGFAIPIDQVRRVAVQLIRTGHATHSVFGATLNTAYTGTGAQIVGGRDHKASPVQPGGPAARAGLRPGDVILKFGPLQIANADALLDAVMSHPPGAKVGVIFRRHGQMLTAKLTLGSAQSLSRPPGCRFLEDSEAGLPRASLLGRSVSPSVPWLSGVCCVRPESLEDLAAWGGGAGGVRPGQTAAAGLSSWPSTT